MTSTNLQQSSQQLMNLMPILLIAEALIAFPFLLWRILEGEQWPILTITLILTNLFLIRKESERSVKELLEYGEFGVAMLNNFALCGLLALFISLGIVQILSLFD